MPVTVSYEWSVTARNRGLRGANLIANNGEELPVFVLRSGCRHGAL
jgi:hypothetical protein